MIKSFGQRGFSPLVILPLIFLISISLIFGSIFFITKRVPKGKNPQPYSTSQPNLQSPVPEASGGFLENSQKIEFESGTKLAFFSTENNNLKKITSLKDLSITNSYVKPIYQDGFIYYADDYRVFRFDLNKNDHQQIYKLENLTLNISKIKLLNNGLYISLLPKNYYGSNEGTIDGLDIQSGIVKQIGTIKYTLYGGVDYLFKTANGADVVGTFGGDGCGGSGEISAILDGQTTQIISTGGGCNFNPRYQGEFNKKLVLLSALKQEYDYTDGEKADSLFILDPVTKQKTDILDLKPYSDRIKRYYYDDVKDKFALEVDNQIWLVDIATKNMEKRPLEVNLNKDLPFNIYFNNNKVYYLKHGVYTQDFAEQLIVYDINQKTSQTINWTRPDNLLIDNQIIGVHNNTPILSIHVSPYPN